MCDEISVCGVAIKMKSICQRLLHRVVVTTHRRRRGTQTMQSASSSSARRRPAAAPNTLVLVHADWCGHCQRFAAVWQRLVRDPRLSLNLRTRAATVESKDIPRAAAEDPVLAKAVAGVQSFPTIQFVRGSDGRLFTYAGPRTVQDILDWVRDLIRQPLYEWDGGEE
jgi:thiol-disulfide isomerase/thioredoxin